MADITVEDGPWFRMPEIDCSKNAVQYRRVVFLTGFFNEINVSILCGRPGRWVSVTKVRGKKWLVAGETRALS